MLPRLERRCFRFRPVAAPGAVSAVVPCPCPPLPGALSSAAAPDPALEARLFHADGATAALEERQSARMIGRRSLVEEVRGQAALLRRPRDGAPPGPRGRRREAGGDARLQRREDGEGARDLAARGALETPLTFSDSGHGVEVSHLGRWPGCSAERSVICDQIDLFVIGSLRQMVAEDHVLARVDRVIDRGGSPTRWPI